MRLWRGKIGVGLLCAAGLWTSASPEGPCAPLLAEPTSKGQAQTFRQSTDLEGLVCTLRLKGTRTPLAFSPDAKTLATVQGYDEICIWDVTTARKMRVLEVKKEAPQWIDALAFSPDGKTLASGQAAHRDRSPVRVWDLASARVIREFEVEQGRIEALAFSPDGRRLAAGAGSERVYLWDAGTGRELHRLERQRPAIGARCGLAFSPDGKALAAGGASVSVWEVESGTRLHLFNEPATKVAFSPDARTLIGAGVFYPFPHARGEHKYITPALYFWDLATGKERRVVPDQARAGGFLALALSPDGKSLALSSPGSGVGLWEVATGSERHLLARPQTVDHSLAFSPDGRRLAVGAGDGLVRIWDPYFPFEKDGQLSDPATPKELERLWTDLALEDAARAYAAISSLTARPESAVPLLRERLRRADLEPRRISQLIADLDSNRFTVREQATRDLTVLGELAEPALRKALESGPTLEARRRIESLLQKIDDRVMPPDHLRQLRAIEILEHIGSAEASGVLEELARGAPGFGLTREAKLSLERLARWKRQEVPCPGNENS